MGQPNYIQNTDSENVESVASFFDDHSEVYKAKYDHQDVFYSYFFLERMKKATEGFDFKGKSIIDVGSGTGALYDYLLDNQVNFSSFLATDISEGMMKQGNVPEERRRVGDIMDIDLGSMKFDFVYFLGVSTYIDPVVMKAQLGKVSKHLNEDGRIIITYTNKSSLDILVRSLIAPIAKLFASKSRILSQSFETWYYSRKEFEKIIPASRVVEKRRGLNHTVFPISRLLPSLSVKLAKKIHRLNEGGSKHFLSSDMLVVIE